MSGFDAVLIANRGEIAVRVARTLRGMGLRSIAVFTDADRGALHLRTADDEVYLGEDPRAYLDHDRIIAAAIDAGAGAIHPGYGFLSESAPFARAVEAAGLVFLGPTPEQLELFGAKHSARGAAIAASVPLLAGTGLLDSLDDALAQADAIGYPVMLKASAGGGGIGMRACRDADELTAAWDQVRRLASSNFASADVFLERLVERARHVEVQVFGDGLGGVVVVGDRDCSLQRRNQKVIEESPAPALPPSVRETMHAAALRMCEQVGYRSAGTVEFVYDAAREEVAFLEVNTRLQVEHPVTEEVHGVDLVEWMVRLGLGKTELPTVPAPRGHAVEARIYAEKPDLGGLPSTGRISGVVTPEGVRFDTGISVGSDVSAHYDPLLGKLIVHAETRDAAFAALRAAIDGSRIDGVATNLGLLAAAADTPSVLAAEHSTATLDGVTDRRPRFEVVRAGTLCTVQDWPGRLGLWHVGIPPSGPMDDRSFRLGNVALGNAEGAPGLEITATGPTLRFLTDVTVMITGAPTLVEIDGAEVEQWVPLQVPAGGVLSIGTPRRGMRTYLLVAGGVDAPLVLGSASTFDLGGIGGPSGRPLAVGDIVLLGATAQGAAAPVALADRPEFPDEWVLPALEGPHAAPEFFTPDDMDVFYDTAWEVHFNSARTGVRLMGPKPTWAREDGGEAGLHPSNIHDTPYSVGAVDYTGDLPILLGPDGPSLGGFTCPATVASGQLWKLGQLSPGDRVRFVPIGDAQAAEVRNDPAALPRADRAAVSDGGVLARQHERADRPALTARRSGDTNLLVEYGPMSLELESRMTVHALAESLRDHLDRVDPAMAAGIIDLTPGIRSLQIHFDPGSVAIEELVDVVLRLDRELPGVDELKVPSRTVHLPLSWDDPATREAIERYMNGVRSDAPWTPWNIEFIRRINGLDSVDDVYRVLFDAEYLVLGLGDVYLGAPVATPIDPRHRLVTTKYNPARTWTPENAVGIGGAFLCIYGMEGPGGYQFVGRTIQVWSTLVQRGPFEPGVPWLLRFFDRISWYPVSSEELRVMRADMAAGRLAVRIEDGEFGLAEHRAFLAREADSIAAFRERQSAAFAVEREAWREAGEFDRVVEEPVLAEAPALVIPDGCEAVEAQFVSSVVRIDVGVGDLVEAGQSLLALEAMKMEAPVLAPYPARIVEVAVSLGDQVRAGAGLLVLERIPA
ncbi:urea carboxylase [Amnibacterium flavum]|uniref:Urea carboxylase n=1 Tax=Amnibacterium flavum TaxID=2173173 RepID=A0A2V1HY72_9MICO|nr:urea carboxylase [Amnibacterium flavum]PVZ95374.1 urea carboxylase [Amnibacterium flavum]